MRNNIARSVPSKSPDRLAIFHLMVRWNERAAILTYNGKLPTWIADAQAWDELGVDEKLREYVKGLPVHANT